MTSTPKGERKGVVNRIVMDLGIVVVVQRVAVEVLVSYFEHPQCLYIQHFELALAYDKALKQTLEQVTKVNGSMVDIYYIDYGNWEQKEISSLLPVPAELQGFPGLVRLQVSALAKV
nr:hypothetical protein BaRGS_015450 [Batillaria attramentaria]